MNNLKCSGIPLVRTPGTFHVAYHILLELGCHRDKGKHNSYLATTKPLPIQSRQAASNLKSALDI